MNDDNGIRPDQDRRADGPTSPGGLLVEVVSDVICPWCYIGKRRLEKALGLLGNPASGTATRTRPPTVSRRLSEASRPAFWPLASTTVSVTASSASSTYSHARSRSGAMRTAGRVAPKRADQGTTSPDGARWPIDRASHSR
ncbi:MAG: DsbA family protein [Gemmataceae bacterium]|nr:DsbA family protein [Gemmataceae bacterium]